MAKRRTLRKQRDKALHELEEYKKLLNRQPVQIVERHETVSKLECVKRFKSITFDRIERVDIKRDMLRDMVDDGLFDDFLNFETEQEVVHYGPELSMITCKLELYVVRNYNNGR